MQTVEEISSHHNVPIGDTFPITKERSVQTYSSHTPGHLRWLQCYFLPGYRKIRSEALDLAKGLASFTRLHTQYAYLSGSTILFSFCQHHVYNDV